MLFACFDDVAWLDDDGRNNYYNALALVINFSPYWDTDWNAKTCVLPIGNPACKNYSFSSDALEIETLNFDLCHTGNMRLRITCKFAYYSLSTRNSVYQNKPQITLIHSDVNEDVKGLKLIGSFSGYYKHTGIASEFNIWGNVEKLYIKEVQFKKIGESISDFLKFTAAYVTDSFIPDSGDSLSVLLPYLTVRYYRNKYDWRTVISADDFSLPGAFSATDCAVTITYDSYFTSIDVPVNVS